MTVPPGAPGGYEVVVHAGRRRVVVARLRAAGHGGRVRLARLRRWLATPQGRRAAVRGARGLMVVGALVGGLALARRWAARAQAAASALVGGYRAVAGAVGSAVRAVRFAVSLRWLSLLARWLARSGTAAGHVRCRECHARIRADARVCRRCGYRDPAGRAAGARTGRRPGSTLRRLARALTLRLYHRCPDCRSAVHADARICRACGCPQRAGGSPRRG